MEEDFKKLHVRDLNSAILEIYFWSFIGAFIAGSIWGFDFKDNILGIVLTIILSIIIPITFKLIFNKYPIEFFRDKYIEKNIKPDIINELILNPEMELNTNMILVNDVSECKYNAERLFSQSKVYLLLGCVISILGVAFFFYLNNIALDNTSFKGNFPDDDFALHLGRKLLEYLPRFGVLFFIEYIAFFFLKQYRILMEEYRYYEAIKRERQDILSAYLLFKDKCDDIEVLKMLMNYLNEHSAKVPYITGSHKIKTEKMLNEDMDFISKLTTLIQTIKTPDKAKE